jgi:hypothetical protein
MEHCFKPVLTGKLLMIRQLRGHINSSRVASSVLRCFSARNLGLTQCQLRVTDSAPSTLTPSKRNFAATERESSCRICPIACC